MAINEIAEPRGYCCNTTNSAVEVDLVASVATSTPALIPSPPNTANQMKDARVGASNTPDTNCLIVRPREILAIKVAVNGAQAIHHAQ